MRRNKLSMLGAGFAMALAGLMGSAQAASTATETLASQVRDFKATGAKHTNRRQTIEETIGGIPRVTYAPDYGMSPKEYGMRYGHGNSARRGNRLRLSHNAKLKRR